MKTTVFPGLTYADIPAAIAFLEAVGFTRTAVYADDAGHVRHAEYAWGEHGAVMFGAPRPEDDSGYERRLGAGSCYCVVPSDADVDRVYAAALGAGATSIQAPTDPDYGGRTCTVRDAEGNQWSFGSYPGA